MSPNPVLVAMLLAVQFGIASHASVHDSGVPQTTACKTCLVADQLAAASIDQQTANEVDIGVCRLVVVPAADYRSAHALSNRQRGPPE